MIQPATPKPLPATPKPLKPVNVDELRAALMQLGVAEHGLKSAAGLQSVRDAMVQLAKVRKALSNAIDCFPSEFF